MATTANTPYLALGFGPGLAPTGERVAVGYTADALLVRAQAGTESHVPWHDIQLSVGGFDHRAMTLAWYQTDQARSVTLSDTVAQQALLGLAPAGLAAQLRDWQRGTQRTHRRSRGGWAILVGVLAAPFILALLLFWQADRVTSWVVDGISVESEHALGDLVFAQTRPTLQLITEGEAVRAVTEIGERLARGAPYTFKWYVADDPMVNAFAMPGGHVVVYTGLLRSARSAEEVAGVLSHEIQHVVQRHSLRAMIHGVGLQALMSMMLGDFSGGVVADLANQLGSLKFSRDNETQADLRGLEVLRREAINPDGMVRFFDALARQEGGNIKWLSTHPPSRERMATLRAAIQRMGGWPGRPLPYDWGNVRASLPPAGS